MDTKVQTVIIAAQRQRDTEGQTEIDAEGQTEIDAVQPLDLLWGCEAIAAYIRRSPRATFHLLETRQIGKKRGRVWVGSRARLAKDLVEDEAEQAAG